MVHVDGAYQLETIGCSTSEKQSFEDGDNESFIEEKKDGVSRLID